MPSVCFSGFEVPFPSSLGRPHTHTHTKASLAPRATHMPAFPRTPHPQPPHRGNFAQEGKGRRAGARRSCRGRRGGGDVSSLSNTRPVLGERSRSPLGRAAALLARCPPPTTSNLDLLCGADRHPSSPFALSGSSVGQRGVFAQTTQLLVPATQTISVS
jgi:hypothetical protein